MRRVPARQAHRIKPSTMRIRILGCSGGISAGLRTTAFLLDDDILIDAGTGVGAMTIEEMCRIRHIFLTHAHLDHIASLPLLLDTLFGNVSEPVTVYGCKNTIKDLKEHMFNWRLWPDFSKLPNAETPTMRFETIEPGVTIERDGRRITPVPVYHSVPTMGYTIQSNGKVLAFSGDTMNNDTFWPAVNAYDSLDILIVEAAFGDANAELAEMAGHYTPTTLAMDLKKLVHDPEIWITSMKPGDEEEIFEQVLTSLPDRRVRRLRDGDSFTL